MSTGFDGSAVLTVRLTATQAALVSAALARASCHFEDPQKEEVELLVGGFADAATDADPEAIYGLCL